MDKSAAINSARVFLKNIQPVVHYRKAVLFGSHQNGTQSEYSDIDVGIFVESLDRDYFSVLKQLYHLRRVVDARIEPHLFVKGADQSGFAEEIERLGEIIS